MTRILAIIFLLLLAAPATAQDSAEAEKSYFLSFVQNQLSTPNRQIVISDIQGVLSSEASIGSITVADREGVWLKVTNAKIVWSRLALLRGRLDVNTLAAERIDILRKPLPDESLPSPEAKGFSLPELPLAVILQDLQIGRIAFGDGVFGLRSEISLAGNLRLEGGSLDSSLQVRRLDGPGGEFQIKAAYANESQQLDLDLTLNEPENGIVANLLNIEGKPPVTLALKGSGPLSDLALQLTLDAAGKRVLTGETRLDRQSDGLQFNTTLNGEIAALIPPVFRDFFGNETALIINGTLRDAGGVALDRLNIKSNALALDATGETTNDGFLRQLKVDATIADPTGKKVILPVKGGQTTVDKAVLAVAFGTSNNNDWTSNIEVTNLTTDSFAAKSVNILGRGLAENIDNPTARSLTYDVNGDVSGITAKRADIAEALGEVIQLKINGDWKAGAPVNLRQALVAANGFSAALAGTINDFAYRGDILVKASSIAPFSALAGRELAGSIDLKANGLVEALTGGFDLMLDGHTTGMQLGIEAADKVLAGETRITGGLARGEAGLSAKDFKVENPQTLVTANGTFASGAANFDFGLDLTDLALLSEKAGGALKVKGSARGQDNIIALAFNAGVPEGTLSGRKLTQGDLTFNGTLYKGIVDGKVSGLALLDGIRADLATEIALHKDEKRLSNVSFIAGGTRLRGDVTQNKKGLLQGNLTLASSDVSTAAALFLVEATGKADATIALTHDEEKQNVDINGQIDGLKANDIVVGKAAIALAAQDIFRVPSANGSVTASNVSAAGIDVNNLDAQATQDGKTTIFTMSAGLKNGARTLVGGSLQPTDAGYRLSLANADLTRGALAARLVQPATIDVAGSNFSLSDIILDVGQGRVTVSGEVAETLNLAVAIQKLPLDIANTIKPDLGLGGEVNGTAKIGGTRQKPDVNFDVQARAITAAALKQVGLDALNLDAKGTSTTDLLNIDAHLTGAGGLDASARGAVPLAQGQLGVDFELRSFPLTALNGVVKGQNLAGNISGRGRVTGTLQRPNAEFDLKGTGLSARPLQEAGLAPLQLAAAGRFVNNTLSLSSAKVDGPQGFTVSANGNVPVSGTGLGINVTGKIPLSLANRFLADRGTQARGMIDVNASVTGNFAKPQISGTFSANGAEVIDPEANIRLQRITLLGSMEGTTVTIRTLNAALSTGGTISATGTISTDAAANFPANIDIRLDRARYADGNLVVATVTGALAVKGPLTRDPVISGNINIDRAEITVPESFGGSSAVIDVKHKDPSKAVAQTLKRAKADQPAVATPTARPSVVRLDINITAPTKIFIRGRGLDAEIGGSVRITGPATNVQPVGAFDLIRGRLGILGQRITFTEGQVTLVGDLDPELNFLASTQGTDITVNVAVRGRVSDLQITFSSQPELPQDEVMARLIFNRSISELSPLQVARLAAAAAELAGGSNSSLLDSLRKSTGLDDLDVVTDSEGNAGVRAGRYIRDNVYLGVEAGAAGKTKGTINLDITPNLKAKGSVGSDGDSGGGLFFEKDY
ncbi:translocation and assembly module protein TamB [Phyllobacterium brassicacearum]|uniref:Translocation and assembly module protein TamB n=1 Tax=Phyllobacterium brassicacearum TaxID=314235 RepID=A0A2P7BJZ0_9HYPH|nr:translocation/assembly module TamB domain-containing protein [Phyllobacterium brassicacearum]PSH66764.1 translocation and assembly module protein TamB [Phyllobacterium brassicacearum]TDQ32093.1 autotransporter secretion inner membrane protein TamB [Phyllobacterium brassicacearum]